MQRPTTNKWWFELCWKLHLLIKGQEKKMTKLSESSYDYVCPQLDIFSRQMKWTSECLYAITSAVVQKTFNLWGAPHLLRVQYCLLVLFGSLNLILTCSQKSFWMNGEGLRAGYPTPWERLQAFVRVCKQICSSFIYNRPFHQHPVRPRRRYMERPTTS